MANDTGDANPEESVPCIALSKNDSYVMSACGGKVSLFNMMTFKVTLIILFECIPRLQENLMRIFSCLIFLRVVFSI
jgi:hypothetical protein